MICVKAKTRIQASLLCFSQAYDAYPLTQYENTLPKICHVIDGHLHSMSHTFTAIYPPCYEEAEFVFKSQVSVCVCFNSRYSLNTGHRHWDRMFPRPNEKCNWRCFKNNKVLTSTIFLWKYIGIIRPLFKNDTCFRITTGVKNLILWWCT